MRAVVQRVSEARVTVAGAVVGELPAGAPGLLVLLGVGEGDEERDAITLADKICRLRVFEDAAGKMNRDLGEVGGGLLVVSQFTLYGDCRKGRRPSFVKALEPVEAERLVGVFVDRAVGQIKRVETGRFRAHMDVALVNDGPVTLLLDSRKAF